MRNWLAGLGVSWPTGSDWIIAGAAIAAVVVAWLIAHVTARKVGPWLAEFSEQRAGARGETLGPRMCDLTRYLIFALLLAIILNADAWRPLGEIVLGIAIAAACALFVLGILRGLAMPRLIAFLLAAVTFVALLTRAVGGLKPVTDTLNRVGFDAGSMRISLLSLVQIAVTVAALYAIVKLLNRIIATSIRKASGFDPTQQLLAQKLASVGIVIAAFFIGIDVLGIDLTALTVFSGAFGLAIGFGLQKTFGNLMAGIILLMDRSIKPGDVIVVGEAVGHVNKIGVRAVSIVTRDGKEHLIPNENLMTQEVENWSYSSRDVRVHIPVGVAYSCDLALAQRLMVEAAAASDRVLDAPAPKVWLTAFGENSVNHDILIWLKDPEAGIGSVRSEILNRLWVLFKENGVELPFPQRDVRVKEWPASPPANPGQQTGG